MRKIILGLAVSLDNRIEGPNGEYDWCFTDQDYGMTDFMNGIDAIFYGRKSYEMMKKAGADMFAGKKNYVFTTNTSYATPDAEIISGDIGNKVEKLLSIPGKNIWLFGGADLTNTFLKLNLVDEIWLSVHSVILGKGKLLFDDLDQRIQTILTSSKTYDTGLVSLTYKVVK